jgi:hypothetical protein
VRKLIGPSLELPPLRLEFDRQPDKRRTSDAVVATAMTKVALRVFEIGALFS